MADAIAKPSTTASSLIEANKEIERLREELDDAQTKLHQIEGWANAYRETIFVTSPTDEQIKEWGELIGQENFTALHGSWGRHITKGIRRIIRGEENGDE